MRSTYCKHMLDLFDNCNVVSFVKYIRHLFPI